MRQISDSGFGAYEVSLATSGEHVITAWYDTRDGNGEIYLRIVTDPQSSEPEQRLTETAAQSYEADVVQLGDAVVVAWYEQSADGRSSARIGAWSRRGQPLWQHAIDADAYSTRIPELVAVEDRLFVAWVEDDENDVHTVRGRWFDESGNPLGETLRLGAASETTWNLNAAALDNDNVLVAFDARIDTMAEELYLSEVSTSSATTQRLTADDGFRSKYPDIALGPNSSLLVWHDERDGNTEIYLHAELLSEWSGTIDADARRITTTTGDSIGAYVAYNAGRFGLAWSDATDGPYDVFFQLIDVNGVPSGTVKRLHASTADSLIPAIEPWGAGYAVAWNEVVRAERGFHDADTRSEILYIDVVL